MSNKFLEKLKKMLRIKSKNERACLPFCVLWLRFLLHIFCGYPKVGDGKNLKFPIKIGQTLTSWKKMAQHNLSPPACII